MYIRIDEELYKKIKNVTMTDYDAQGNLISAESIEPMFEDLLLEINRLEEKYNDLEQDLQDNYRAIPYAEQVGISDKDFI